MGKMFLESVFIERLSYMGIPYYIGILIKT